MIDVLNYPFIQNAIVTGTFVAVIAAIVGYFMISRGLTFAGHALPNIGFAGAAGAVYLGINPIYGLFVFTIAAAIGIGLIGKEIRDRDISIGVLMTFALGIGLMFLTLYSGYAERVYSILFGTILGISRYDVKLTAISALITIGVLLIIYRPLLFSTFDPLVAEARGVPVRFLAVFFLILVAVPSRFLSRLWGLCWYSLYWLGLQRRQPVWSSARYRRFSSQLPLASVMFGSVYCWLRNLTISL